MKKSEIKELVKEQEERLNYLQNGYREDEEYKELCKQYNILQNKIRDVQNKWYEDNKESQNICRDEIRDLKKMLSYKGELDPLNYSREVQEAFALFYRGTTAYSHRKLIWVSKDENYCVLKMPSHSSYTNRFSGTQSSPNCWFLVDVKKFKGGFIFCESIERGVLYYREGGRWSKAFEEDMLSIIEEYEKTPIKGFSF